VARSKIASGLTASRRQRDGISGRLPVGLAPTLITWRSAALTATSAWLPRWSRSRSRAKIPRRAGITASPIPGA